MTNFSYDQFEIIGYDVVSDSGAIVAPMVDLLAAEQIKSAQGGVIIPVLRSFAHRAAYVVRQEQSQ